MKQYFFTYIPFNDTFPIKSCQILIVAESRKEAELIALDSKYKFFNESSTCNVQEGLIVYEDNKIPDKNV